jgi:hypothetical protein
MAHLIPYLEKHVLIPISSQEFCGYKTLEDIKHWLIVGCLICQQAYIEK